MWLTQMDIINLGIAFKGDQKESKIIDHLVKKNEKENDEMIQGMKYYQLDHAISKRVITYWNGASMVPYKSGANNKLIYPFHRNFVDQKVDKVVGDPPIVMSDSDEQLKATMEVLGSRFGKKIQRLSKGSANKGREWLHFFVDNESELDEGEDAEFHWVVVGGERVIPIYDMRFDEKLVEVIRYFEVEKINVTRTDGKTKTIFKVEWWTKNDVTFWEQTENKERYVKDTMVAVNPQFHLNIENEEPKGWGRVPWELLPNNDDQSSDLKPIKALIDAYDLVNSDMANNLQDVQEVIWKLKGYQGEDLKQFMNDLKVFKAIRLDADGDAVAETLDIPIEAREAHLKRLTNDIHLFGRGVNNQAENLGTNNTGVFLKFLFAWLDLKCKDLRSGLDMVFESLFWFVTEFLRITEGTKFEPTELSVTYNESIIINESELIDDLVKEKINDLNDIESLLALNPHVNDPKATLKKIKKDQKERMTLIQDSFDTGDDDE